MTDGLQRQLARHACRVLMAMLPSHLKDWGTAICCETAAIAADRDALAFACASLLGLAPRIIAYHLARPFASLPGAEKLAETEGEFVIMQFLSSLLLRPRLLGAICATTAVLLGLAVMALGGAPASHLTLNAASLVIGMILLGAWAQLSFQGARLPRWSLMAMAIILLATALFGFAVEGASRWLQIGPLAVQPSLILLPPLMLGFAQTRDWPGAAALAVAASALAMQPDRAMAGALLAGLAGLALLRVNGPVMLALATSAGGFAVTCLRPDTLPAAAFVDGVLQASFALHPLAGLAIVVGAAALLVPGIAGLRRANAGREIAAMFAVLWLAILAAAALANYPAPLVGYGGSAILGYMFSLAFLPLQAETQLSAKYPSAASTEPAINPGKLSILAG